MRCSGVNVSQHKATQTFVCGSCKAERPIIDVVNTDQNVDICNKLSLKKVDEFC